MFLAVPDNKDDKNYLNYERRLSLYEKHVLMVRSEYMSQFLEKSAAVNEIQSSIEI